jgi:hypothetical protein
MLKYERMKIWRRKTQEHQLFENRGDFNKGRMQS